MALLTPYRNKIIISVSDKVYNDTIIKQEATFVKLQHHQDYMTGVSTVEIFVLVCAYSNDNGAKGIALNTKGIPDRLYQLVADNNTLVDVQTGELLAIRSGEDDAAWNAEVASFSQDTMLQGDYFTFLRDTNPVRIGDMIIANIMQADTVMHKFSQ